MLVPTGRWKSPVIKGAFNYLDMQFHGHSAGPPILILKAEYD